MKIKIGNVILNPRCVLFGHKISDTTDSGDLYCKRCSAHEFYSSQDYLFGDAPVDIFTFTVPQYYYNLKYKWSFRIRYWFREFIYQKCDSCDKPKRILSKWVGNHNECLPF